VLVVVVVQLGAVLAPMQEPHEYHLIKHLVISYTGVHLIRPLSPQAGEGFPNPMSCRS
jgi:hypothetical protein